jgi:hypothetical protein
MKNSDWFWRINGQAFQPHETQYCTFDQPPSRVKTVAIARPWRRDPASASLSAYPFKEDRKHCMAFGMVAWSIPQTTGNQNSAVYLFFLTVN